MRGSVCSAVITCAVVVQLCSLVVVVVTAETSCPADTPSPAVSCQACSASSAADVSETKDARKSVNA